MPDIYEIQVADEAHLLHLKEQLLDAAQHSGSCSFLDSCGYTHTHGAYAWLCAMGSLDRLQDAVALRPPALAAFLQRYRGYWLMGHLAFEALQHPAAPAQLPDTSGFSQVAFWVPEVVVYQPRGLQAIRVASQVDGLPAHTWWQQLQAMPAPDAAAAPMHQAPIQFTGPTQQAYVAAVEALRRHIGRGDCYEINFCQRFEARVPALPVLDTFRRLRAASPNPFCAYYKLGHSHLLCASPERFLCGSPARLMSQPMKGTAPRHLHAPLQDAAAATALQQHPKERSENIMVVDLVRNDLAQVCVPGTVQVEELCGVYPFPRVHQMISTVSGTPAPHTGLADWLQATFPMGSMSGAPKKRVLELIARYETHARGIFSGCVGYIDPQGSFDLNVVIRSIIYNAATSQLTYWAGSGITWHSRPGQEYLECQLKAAAIQEVLQSLAGE